MYKSVLGIGDVLGYYVMDTDKDFYCWFYLKYVLMVGSEK